MSPCILWGGVIDRDGYGKLGNKLAHRIAYVKANGLIPSGLTIDHLCRVRSCVNPEHLEAVSRRENTMRGIGLAAINARKTVCAKGHPFNEQNTHHTWAKDRQGRPTRRRICRSCNVLAVQSYRIRKGASA